MACYECFWTTVLFLQCISVELAYVSNLIQSWLVKFFGYIFYSFFFFAEYHVTEHWALHEAGHCGQEPRCIQCCTGLISGKATRNSFIHFANNKWPAVLKYMIWISKYNGLLKWSKSFHSLNAVTFVLCIGISNC